MGHLNLARIRTVKPEFWTDDRLGECSVSARLLFIATWNFADDKGGLARSAKQLKAQAFPYDNLDCEPLVQELLKVGVLIEYEVCGKKYLHIKGFCIHQKIDNPAKPRVPIYVPEASPPRVLPESSPSPSASSLGREGKRKGREGKNKSAAEAAVVVLHETLPTEEWEQWITLRRKRRWPTDEVTLRKQLGVLQDRDTESQRQIINASINAGWQGLFPPRTNGVVKPKYVPSPTTEELEAREAARAGK